ncbi:MAG: hypothetical protein WBG92_01005 [Thiohalocapsa sp.]
MASSSCARRDNPAKRKRTRVGDAGGEQTAALAVDLAAWRFRIIARDATRGERRLAFAEGQRRG